jgi:hypothetical protein
MLRPRTLLTICLAALLADCSHGPERAAEEDLPVTQASSVFGQDDDGPVRQTETLALAPLPDGTLHYTLTLVTVATSRPSSRDERVMTDYVTDMAGHVMRFFDKDKKFNSIGESQVEDRLIHLWMPQSARKDGGEIALEGFPDPLQVSGPVTWKKWSVWKAQFRDQQYLYDAKTGFLVGNVAGSDTWVLEQSTVPGLAQ